MTPALRRRPTEAELEILQVLWARGPLSVRAVYEALAPETGYTTVLKLMQIMVEKGLLTRDTSAKIHIYSAASPEQQTKGHLLDHFLDTAFRGSAKDLILQALSARRADRAELAEIRQIIEQFEKG
jgi:predicted transcriptional regulator